MTEIDFKNMFLDELVRKRPRGGVVTYEVFREDQVVEEKGSYYPVKVVMKVGTAIVLEKEYSTKFGSEDEVLRCQMRAINQMISELPFLYQAVHKHMKEFKDKTLAEKALEVFVKYKEVIESIGTRNI